MSNPGNAPFSLAAVLNQGSQAAGDQAQTNVFLQLFQQLVVAAQGGGVAFGGLYTIYAWAGGNLDIAAQFPLAKSGTFILTAAAVVTLPSTGGPWIIADGPGFCDPTAQIEVKSTGVTVQQAASYYMVQQFQAQTFIKDTGHANYIVL